MTHWLETATKEQIEDALRAVRESSMLNMVGYSDEEIILMLARDEIALYEMVGYLDHQWPEICLAAVKMNGHSLLHIHKQTEEMCRIAIKGNYMAHLSIKDEKMHEKLLKEMVDKSVGSKL